MNERPKKGYGFSEFLLGFISIFFFLPLNGIQVSSTIQSLAANSDRPGCLFECMKCLSPVLFQTLEADIVCERSRLLSKVQSFVHVSESTGQTFTGQEDRERKMKEFQWRLNEVK